MLSIWDLGEKLGRLGWLDLFGAGLILVLIVLILRALAKSGRALDLRTTFSGGKGETLVALVHGYRHRNASLKGLQTVITEVFPDANILIADFFSGTFSNAQPEVLASDLEREINEADKIKDYKRIVLIGHSLGGLLVRKAYVYGCGQVQDRGLFSTDTVPHKWVDKADRLVLVAGMNRGWSISPRPSLMSIRTKALIALAWQLGRWTGTAKLARGIERGAPFIANLRLQWLNAIRNGRQVHKPIAIQLLGDQDDAVRDEDSRDVAVAQGFVSIRVPKTGHGSIIEFDHPDYGSTRKRLFRDAVEASIEKLQEEHRETPLQINATVKKLVFVVHGIRDTGGWTLEFADYLKKASSKAGDPPGSLSVITAQYAYFPMAAFLLVSDRQKNVRWFMDKFTEAKARYPNLREVDFVGHSNGTFILASALRRYASQAEPGGVCRQRCSTGFSLEDVSG